MAPDDKPRIDVELEEAERLYYSELTAVFSEDGGRESHDPIRCRRGVARRRLTRDDMWAGLQPVWASL